jgi:hypothetical protein
MYVKYYRCIMTRIITILLLLLLVVVVVVVVIVEVLVGARGDLVVKSLR